MLPGKRVDLLKLGKIEDGQQGMVWNDWVGQDFPAWKQMTEEI